MSIVINLLFRDYSILVSDTRAMGYDQDGNSVIASENFPKVFSVSKGLAYGYTGCAPFAAALSEQVNRLAPLECMYSDQLAYFLHRQIHSLLPKYKDPRPGCGNWDSQRRYYGLLYRSTSDGLSAYGAYR